MKTALVPALAFALALGLLGPASAQPSGGATVPTAATAAAPAALTGAERTAALGAANRALNAVTSLQGRFRQVSPDGSRSAGAFYLQRPGRLRFEYDSPATLLIVASGGTLYMRDRALRTTERTTLDSTPLNLILKSSIDLNRDARITRVTREAGALLVTARDRTGRADGQITLRLEGPNMELRSWDVVDATGARTRVSLTEVSRPANIDRRLFRVEDVLDPGRHGPG